MFFFLFFLFLFSISKEILGDSFYVSGSYAQRRFPSSLYHDFSYETDLAFGWSPEGVSWGVFFSLVKAKSRPSGLSLLSILSSETSYELGGFYSVFAEKNFLFSFFSSFGVVLTSAELFDRTVLGDAQNPTQIDSEIVNFYPKGNLGVVGRFRCQTDFRFWDRLQMGPYLQMKWMSQVSQLFAFSSGFSLQVFF